MGLTIGNRRDSRANLKTECFKSNLQITTLIKPFKAVVYNQVFVKAEN
jgi:hypothetical protein